MLAGVKFVNEVNMAVIGCFVVKMFTMCGVEFDDARGFISDGEAHIEKAF